MNLLETKQNYRSNLLTKNQYIDEMYDFHKILFDYSRILKETNIEKIEVVDGGLIFTFSPHEIKLFSSQADKRTVPFETLNFDGYEKVDSDMILRLIESDYHIFDVGANVGWYSLNIAKIYPNAKISSFEPVLSTFLNLKQNIEINNAQNIQIYNFGFSDEEKTLTFYLQPESSVSASAANITDSNNAVEVVCKVKRLDDFVKEKIDCKIDFIKCDVEGAELFVYLGGIESIQLNLPIIFTEMLRKWSAKFNYNPNEIINLLARIGYRCFAARGNHLIEILSMDESTIETNFFFLHSEKHLDKIQNCVI
ncbi:MAG: FkbM family methyltransferase [Snowella sp.]|nr:FkbM family methyltransferase [Snowella sp.]